MRALILILASFALLASATAHADPYPEEVRKAFMDACSPQGGAEMCGCVLKKFEATVSFDDFANQAFEPKLIETWTVECLGAGGGAATPPTPPTPAADATCGGVSEACVKEAKRLSQTCSYVQTECTGECEGQGLMEDDEIASCVEDCCSGGTLGKRDPGKDCGEAKAACDSTCADGDDPNCHSDCYMDNGWDHCN